MMPVGVWYGFALLGVCQWGGLVTKKQHLARIKKICPLMTKQAYLTSQQLSRSTRWRVAPSVNLSVSIVEVGPPQNFTLLVTYYTKIFCYFYTDLISKPRVRPDLQCVLSKPAPPLISSENPPLTYNRGKLWSNWLYWLFFQFFLRLRWAN